MKLFAAALAALAGLTLARAEKTLLVAAIETPDERAEVFFSDEPLTEAITSWGDSEKLALARFRRIHAHQQEVYGRYVNTDRGRALLLARDFFAAHLHQLVKDSAQVRTLTAKLPKSPDVALLRLALADQVSVRSGRQTVRSQSLVVSAEDLQGNLLMSAPIQAVTVRKGVEDNDFDDALFRDALERAARAVAAHFFPTPAQAASPLYEIGAVRWEVPEATFTRCCLQSERLAPMTAHLLAGLQPTVAWSARTERLPLDLASLAIADDVIAGETVPRDCAVARYALLQALNGAGKRAILRGAQSDALRAAQGVTLPDRTIELRILTCEQSAMAAGPATALPLPVQGALTVTGLLAVADRATGDILHATPLALTLPVETALDLANPETAPFPLQTALQLFAEHAAKSVP